MVKKSNPRLRQILLLATLSIGFVSFAVLPLISILQPTPKSSVAPDVTPKKEEILKTLQEQDKVYQTILDREPKNQTALKGVVDARLKMFQLTGNPQMLSKSLAPLDEIIKQDPKNETLLALKKQIQVTINKETEKTKN